MFIYLLLLFTVIPILELSLLIRVGAYLGAFNTVMIVVLTGMAGAYFARLEGLRVLFGVQKDLNEGRMPTEALIDGLLILVGAVLLITPGILTDIVGFMLVIPATRLIIKAWLKYKFQKIIDGRDGVITVEGFRENED
ncbi:FxsA family protein [Thermoproteota archaeon]